MRWMLLTLVVSAFLGGCSKDNVGGQGKLNEGNVIGKFLQSQQPGQNYKTHRYRLFTFNADKTFTMQFANLQGKPETGDAPVQGTWSMSGDKVTLSISTNKLPEKDKPLTPVQVVGIYPSAKEADGKDRLIIETEGLTKDSFDRMQ